MVGRSCSRPFRPAVAPDESADDRHHCGDEQPGIEARVGHVLVGVGSAVRRWSSGVRSDSPASLGLGPLKCVSYSPKHYERSPMTWCARPNRAVASGTSLRPSRFPGQKPRYATHNKPPLRKRHIGLGALCNFPGPRRGSTRGPACHERRDPHRMGPCGRL